MWEKLLRDVVEYVIMGLCEHTDTILNWIQLI